MRNFHLTFVPVLFVIAGSTPFSEALPIPQKIVVRHNQRDLTIKLTEIKKQLLPGSPVMTTMWGYNGSSPGPTIEVEKGQMLRVHWKNELPMTHVLPAPEGMMTTGIMPGDRVVMDGPPGDGMGEGASLPEVRNVTHLHGAMVFEHNPLDRLYNNDGWPDAWNVPGEEQIAVYPNEQDARALWYHDHAFGETGRNVAAGLAGMYLIRDGFERSLNLPSGKYEIPLILQAVGINGDGSLFYTNQIWNEFYGNSVAVNGKILPYLEVEPRKYRFRILNASNSRMYSLKLVDELTQEIAGPAFYQIGTDSGFLERTATLNDPHDPNAPMLVLASAERADVIIDFSKEAGKNFILSNTGAVTDREGEMPVPELMLFKVKNKVSRADTSSLPNAIRHIKHLKPERADEIRKIVITQMDMPDGSAMFRLNNRGWNYKKMDASGDYWDYEIDTKPVVGSTEIWELVNTTRMIHPFHVHPVQFQILDRTPFDVNHYNQSGEIIATGPSTPPDPNESAWKDVVRASPGQVTRIIMKFGPYTGYFVYHCHLLEHEDMDMMIPYQVVSKTEQRDEL